MVPHRRPLELRDGRDEEPRRQRHGRHLRRPAGARRRPRSNGAPTGSRSTSPTAAALPASYDFEAGWYVEAKALDTPEALKVSLDKALYAVGDTARVHLEPRFDGVALVMVVDDRLIATKSVEVTGNAADIDLDVTATGVPAPT